MVLEDLNHAFIHQPLDVPLHNNTTSRIDTTNRTTIMAMLTIANQSDIFVHPHQGPSYEVYIIYFEFPETTVHNINR